MIFSSLSSSDCLPDSALDRVMCLVSPFAGLHNLDFSSDSLLDTIGGGNFWEQFTPSTEGPHNSVSAADVEQPIARAYQSEADMYTEKPPTKENSNLLIVMRQCQCLLHIHSPISSTIATINGAEAQRFIWVSSTISRINRTPKSGLALLAKVIFGPRLVCDLSPDTTFSKLFPNDRSKRCAKTVICPYVCPGGPGKCGK